MKPLAPGYSAQVDGLQTSEWTQLTSEFADNNLYQAWAYEAARNVRTSHLVLRYEGQVVAVAQARLAQLKATPLGIAYVRWGPLWRRLSGASYEHLQQALRAVRNEYVLQRGLCVRLLPPLFDDGTHLQQQIFTDEGFALRQNAPIARTLLVDLTKDLATIRSGLDKKWRNILNKAERSELHIVLGTDSELFSTFVPLYAQMVRRKKFDDGVDIRHFLHAQTQLPDQSKMLVQLCYSHDEKICAGVVISALGDTGVYLFGATNELGMKTGASYLLQWHAIQRLKELGIATYNLHGINPQKNPGTYHFKAGLCGRNGSEARFIGQYESCGHWLTKRLIGCGEMIRMGWLRISPRTA